MILKSDPFSVNRRNIQLTSSAIAKSFEKLSSGKKVNGASDDASALAIIGQMESQLSSINSSLSNDQFNKAMYQVADGALSQVSPMLSQMQALSIRASNSTLSSSDRAAINYQMNELSSQISMMQSQTAFNGQPVFNQNFQVMADKTSPAGNSSVKGTTTGGTQKTDQYEATIKYNQGEGSAKVLQNPVNVTSNASLMVSTHRFQVEELFNDYGGKNSVSKSGNITINGTDISVQSGDTLDTVVSKINSANSSTGVVATTNGRNSVSLVAGKLGPEYAAETSYQDSKGKFTFGSEGKFTIGGDSQILNDLGFGASNLTSRQLRDAPVSGLQYDMVSNSNKTTEFTSSPGSKNGEYIYEVTDKNSDFYGLKFSIDYNKVESVIGPGMDKFYLPHLTTSFDISFTKTSNAENSSASSTGNNGVRNSNAGNSSGNSPSFMDSLQSINLSSASAASSAINTLDQAMNEINRIRAGIGGNINRIDSNTSSLMIKRENTTAALSKLQDADIAIELSNLTKNLIQDKAGMAVLAHSMSSMKTLSLLS